MIKRTEPIITVKMATLLYTIFSFTASASLHCAVRREISPCTCSPHQLFANTISVTCEKMESFSHVVDVLQDKFTPDLQIWLKITHSQMIDFEKRHFAEMNMNVKNLRLNYNNMRWVRWRCSEISDSKCTRDNFCFIKNVKRSAFYLARVFILKFHHHNRHHSLGHRQ